MPLLLSLVISHISFAGQIVNGNLQVTGLTSCPALITDSSGNLSCGQASIATNPSAPVNSVQYNNQGSFGGSNNFVFIPNGTNNNVGIGSSMPGSSLDVSGTVRVFNGNVGINTALPADSLFVQGNIGIGTQNKIFMGVIPLAWGQTNQRNYFFGNAGKDPVVGIGTDITAMGNGAAANDIDGAMNTVVGSNALHYYDTDPGLAEGNGNSAFGFSAMGQANSAGGSNSVAGDTAIGENALLEDNGGQNTCVGTGCFFQMSNVSAVNNVCMGYDCFSGNLTGANTELTGLGYIAGSNATSGTQLLMLGSNSQPKSGSDTNEIVLGQDTTGNGSGTLTLGNSATNVSTIITGDVGIGKTNPAQVLDVNGSVKFTNLGFQNISLDVNGTLRVFNGNVGIGSTIPGQALDVVGTVRSTLGFSSDSNCFYYCNGGVDLGVLSRGSSCLCPGGSCVVTNICSN